MLFENWEEHDTLTNGQYLSSRLALPTGYKFVAVVYTKFNVAYGTITGYSLIISYGTIPIIKPKGLFESREKAIDAANLAAHRLLRIMNELS